MNVFHRLLMPAFFAFSLQSFAAPDVVLLSKAEVVALIGAYPARGTQAEAMDDEVLLDWQQKRTKADCDYAAENEVTITNLFGGRRGPLTAAEIKSLPLSLKAMAPAEFGANAVLAKRVFNRPRPYLRNPDLTPCIEKESSTAYPSGHAMYARGMARLLSKRFPHKTEQLMKRGDEAAMNRVIGGVHHPSDIEAGKILGDEIARRILRGERFRLSQ
jgi:acid phosphatase (class A)